MNGAMLQAFGALALVIALMFASAWVFRRSGGLKALSRGPVRLVGGISVGSREKVILLEVADSWVLVGVAPGQVSALHTLPRQELRPEQGGQSAGAPFQQLLARLAPRGTGGAQS
ncbi:MAG: flagellar biosynthetic protein FliO [Pseudomonadota bacterium]|nr:flagellar biosynthetic protein FliO [Pseudomonadota bacterium]